GCPGTTARTALHCQRLGLGHSWLHPSPSSSETCWSFGRDMPAVTCLSWSLRSKGLPQSPSCLPRGHFTVHRGRGSALPGPPSRPEGLAHLLALLPAGLGLALGERPGGLRRSAVAQSRGPPGWLGQRQPEQSVLPGRLSPERLYPGRIIFSLDFILFCLRLMHIFTISKTLGPKIIMLKRMMKDVFFFLFLLAVWVVSFGVAMQAILIHNESRVDWIFRGAVYQSFLTVFGQIPAYIDGVNFSLDHCSPNGTDPYKPKCPESDAARKEPAFPEWLMVILLCLYLLLTNILLLNLLIAMFNYTFQQVQECTDQIWKFQRLDLIEEYQSRPPAPPPFIILNHLLLFIKRVVLKIPARRHQELKNKLEKNEEATLLTWERYLKENYLQNEQHQQSQRPEQKIQDMSQKYGWGRVWVPGVPRCGGGSCVWLT
ncbi:Transient receptor potential cation channel subfamily M member 2, partial [Galemys pyrenaicus]